MSAERTDDIILFTMRVTVDGRVPLPSTLREAEVIHGVLTHMLRVEPTEVRTLNETLFLVGYAADLNVEEIIQSVGGIDNWLGKSVTIVCDHVTDEQLPRVLAQARVAGTDSVVFNGAPEYDARDAPEVGELHTPSPVPMVEIGEEARSHRNYQPSRTSSQDSHHSTSRGPSGSGEVNGVRKLNKVPTLPKFSGNSREGSTVPYMIWLTSVRDARVTYNEISVRAAISTSCIGDAANALSNLRVGYTVDTVIKEFNYLYGQAESFDSLMQEFYKLNQGKGEKISAYTVRLKSVLSAIERKFPNNIRESEYDRHMLDRLFHGMQEGLRNALRYKYDGEIGLHYSDLVMAARGIEGKCSNVVVSKAAVSDTAGVAESVQQHNSQAEAVAEQIALLMSAIQNNQSSQNKENNGGGKFSKPQYPRKDWSKMTCWSCGIKGHPSRKCRNKNPALPFKPAHLNGQGGEEAPAANPPPPAAETAGQQ